MMDECVIYYSNEDDCWIAHSLRMDQIGTGPCAMEALSSLLRAVDFVMEDAAKDERLAYLREAPQDIQALKQIATRLPREVFEIAYKMAHGRWPQDAPLILDASEDHPYVAEIEEEDAVGV